MHCNKLCTINAAEVYWAKSEALAQGEGKCGLPSLAGGWATSALRKMSANIRNCWIQNEPRSCQCNSGECLRVTKAIIPSAFRNNQELTSPILNSTAVSIKTIKNCTDCSVTTYLTSLHSHTLEHQLTLQDLPSAPLTRAEQIGRRKGTWDHELTVEFDKNVLGPGFPKPS